MLGEVIKKLREESGLTQNDVVTKAKELSENSVAFNQSQLSKWEKGESAPTDRNIGLLAKIFNCSKEELTQKMNKNDEIYSTYGEGVEIGKNFKTGQIQKVMLTTLDYKNGYEEQVQYLMDFLMKNGVPIPTCFIKILSITKENPEDDRLLGLFYSFIMGFWNGTFTKVMKEDI